MGQSIYNITAPEDQDRLRVYLSTDNLSEPEWRKYFNIRLKRAGTRTESPVYEPVNVMGMPRLNQTAFDCSNNSSSSNSSTSDRDAASNAFNNDVIIHLLNAFFGLRMLLLISVLGVFYQEPST